MYTIYCWKSKAIGKYDLVMVFLETLHYEDER